MVEHRIGEGDVPIKVGDENLIMKPSWGAAQQISSRFGGITGAVDKVIRLDIETITAIVTFGLGFFGTRKPPADLQERIWRTGLTDISGGIAEACVKYLHVLANGGRPPPAVDGEAADTAENPSINRSINDT